MIIRNTFEFDYERGLGFPQHAEKRFVLRLKNAVWTSLRCLQNHSTPKNIRDGAFVTSFQVGTKLKKPKWNPLIPEFLETRFKIPFQKGFRIATWHVLTSSQVETKLSRIYLRLIPNVILDF